MTKTLVGTPDPDPYENYRRQYKAIMTATARVLRNSGRLTNRR